MRESRMAKEFKRGFDEKLQKNMQVTFSNQDHWQIALEHLQTLYGKYANPQFCIKHYYESDAYKNNRQIIHCCEDIPEISMKDILLLLDEEKKYNKITEELLLISGEADSPEKIERMARLLGIFPDKNDQSLYRYLVAKDAISEDEWVGIRKKVQENLGLLGVIVSILSKTFIHGYLLDFPAIENVMTQPRNRYYYRGENAYYGYSKASRYRIKEDDRLSPFLREFIARMRRYQCWDTFDKFDAIHRWGFGSINYMALAQHYGLKTEMLDVTSDLKTALFFACCKYDSNQKWSPLSKDDFAHKDSRAYIDGDSRYGVLFRSPTELTDISWCEETEGKKFNSITPIGYQPFMRCSQQHGYMLLTSSEDDLFLDKRFDKFKFRLTEEICNWIFDEMQQGALIYPNDDVPDISAEIEGINTITMFSQGVFEEVAKDFNISHQYYDDLIKMLKKVGIEIKENVTVIEPNKLEQINQDYSAEKVMKMIGITPQLSPLIIL